MKIYIDSHKNFVIITPPKTIRANLPIKISNSVNDDIKFILSCNESLAKYKIKTEVPGLLYGCKYGH